MLTFTNKRMLAAATLVTALARPGLANLSNDAAAASELFRQGLSDMLAGRYETACPRLEESQHLDPQLGTLFTLAECSAKAEKIASAVAYYEDFLAATKKLPKASVLAYERRIRIAESQCAALKSDIPWLTLIFPDDAPPGTVVKKDGIVLGPAAIRARRSLRLPRTLVRGRQGLDLRRSPSTEHQDQNQGKKSVGHSLYFIAFPPRIVIPSAARDLTLSPETVPTSLPA